MVGHDNLSIVYQALTLLKDFDFGEDISVNLSQACNFPWLLANARPADGCQMATAKEYLILKKKGYIIGLFGLAGTLVEHAQNPFLVVCLWVTFSATGRQIVNTFRWTAPSLILCLWRAGSPACSVSHMVLISSSRLLTCVVMKTFTLLNIATITLI